MANQTIERNGQEFLNINVFSNDLSHNYLLSVPDLGGGGKESHVSGAHVYKGPIVFTLNELINQWYLILIFNHVIL